MPGGEWWELLQPECWVKTLFSLPGSWGIKARQGGGRVSAAPSPPGPFACRSQPRGARQHSHLPAPPGPTKATPQVICSRARGGGLPKTFHHPVRQQQENPCRG